MGTSAAVTRDEPWIPASEEPKPSFTMTFGKVARMRALHPVDSGAPPFEIANSELRSGRSSSGIASQASSSGLATASPTTVIDCTPSSATVRHTRAGSSEPGIRTTRAPQKNHMNDVHCAAACISGASGM